MVIAEKGRSFRNENVPSLEYWGFIVKLNVFFRINPVLRHARVNLK